MAAIFLLSLIALILLQNHLLYQPRSGPSEPSQAGLANFSRHTLAAQGLPTISYWENHAVEHAPTILYFHGNGGGLFLHVRPLDAMDKAGFHVVAMEYPGYPGAEGTPSERVIIAQALILADSVRKQSGDIAAFWGYSLGSGVATHIAAKQAPRALILEAPYTAAVDRAAEIFPLAPVSIFMRDQYRSRDYIGQVKAPIFIMHGDMDTIIPIHHGRDLFALAPEPKIFKEYPGFGHLDLVDSNAYKDAFSFIREQTKD